MFEEIKNKIFIHEEIKCGEGLTPSIICVDFDQLFEIELVNHLNNICNEDKNV
jgi:hypothetical protein